MIVDLPKIMASIEPLLKISTPNISPTPLILTPPLLRSIHKVEIENVLSELSTAVDVVEQARIALDGLQKDLYRKLAAYRNAFTPALALPVEVLRQIFLLAIDDSELTVTTRNSINLVSSSWRSVALGYPELWTRVHLSWPPSEALKSDVVSQLLHRSGKFPIHISTTYPDHWERQNDPLEPVSERLTSVSVQWRDWDANAKRAQPLLRQLAEIETIKLTTTPFIIDGSRSARCVIRDVEHLDLVRHLVLLHAGINCSHPIDDDGNRLPGGQEIFCETLTVVNSSVEETMLTLASIPVLKCRNLNVSGIQWFESSQGCDDCVDYTRYYENHQRFVKWLQPDYLLTFTIEHSNRLLELICFSWGLESCKSFTIRLETARDRYRFKDFTTSICELLRYAPNLTTLAFTGRVDAINDLCQALDLHYYGEGMVPLLSHLRIELSEEESNERVWNLDGRVLQYQRPTHHMMLKTTLNSTQATNWDRESAEGELDDSLLDIAMRRPGFDDDEKKDWEEVGQHLETLLRGLLGPPPLQYGRHPLKELEISRVFALRHVELLKEFEGRGGKLTIL